MDPIVVDIIIGLVSLLIGVVIGLALGTRSMPNLRESDRQRSSQQVGKSPKDAKFSADLKDIKAALEEIRKVQNQTIVAIRDIRPAAEPPPEKLRSTDYPTLTNAPDLSNPEPLRTQSGRGSTPVEHLAGPRLFTSAPPGTQSGRGPIGESSYRARPSPSIADIVIQQYSQNPQIIKKTYDVREFTVSNMQAVGKEHGAQFQYRFVEQGAQGEYWFIRTIEPEGIAVPRPKQTYNLGQFRSAGMSEVFACGGLEEGYRYRRLKVLKAARFRRVGDDSLEMVEKGELQLDDEEKEV